MNINFIALKKDEFKELYCDIKWEPFNLKIFIFNYSGIDIICGRDNYIKFQNRLNYPIFNIYLNFIYDEYPKLEEIIKKKETHN